MPEHTMESDMLIQNLSDAGLSPKEIEQFMVCYMQKKQVAQMQILNEYRGKLLGAVQDNQEKLYCLDYLIRKLKTETKTGK
ncbi:MAG: hypothetical protein LIP16_00765 [Clostridium sp.]|nr:hypothetical protein [Clostridium sp.]